MASKGQVPTTPGFVRLAAHPLRWRLLSELADSDLRVRELVIQLDEPQNLLSYHLRQLRDGGLVTARRSNHDGRDSYYHLDLDRCAESLDEVATALHPALGRTLGEHGPAPVAPGRRRRSRPSVLFVCTGNSSRSPMAEALLRRYAAGSVTVASAGTRPKTQLHPNAVRVLGDQFGIDVAAEHPRHVDTLVGRRFDRVVTLCDKARETLPDLTQHPRRAHWSIEDPAAAGGSDRASYPAFRRVATDIDVRIRHLLPTLAPTNH